MKPIRLPRGEWFYDPSKRLGQKGGFGEVFEGSSEKCGQLAIKRLHLDAHTAAHRELRMADDLMRRTLVHVIPFLDAGMDAESGSYFLVMPRAEKSLQDELRQNRSFQDSEAVDVLLQIVTGLAEVPDIVHRDLKPANVLYHESKWKIADFGIARFVEKSTSLQTLKECLTPPYAAPEQWRMETASQKTDIYALGCIGYALLTGSPPFKGPDFSRQHQQQEPPPLEIRNSKLRSIIDLMLRKLPEVRPSLERVRSCLREISQHPENDPPQPDYEAIARAGAIEAERISKEEALRLTEQSKQKRRSDLAAAAVQILRQICERLFDSILRASPVARRTGDGIELGPATIEVQYPWRNQALPDGAFPQSQWDMVAGATIAVRQPSYGRSASLWYGKPASHSDYRWWETSYFQSALIARVPRDQPFALTNLQDADLAMSRVMHVFAEQEKLKTIDGEDEEKFCSRWRQRFAEACEGRLRPPNPLRERE